GPTSASGGWQGPAHVGSPPEARSAGLHARRLPRLPLASSRFVEPQRTRRVVMRNLLRKKLLVLAAVAVAAAVLAAVGISAVTSQTVMSDGTNLHMRVVKTVADSFDSGWHVHPGP